MRKRWRLSCTGILAVIILASMVRPPAAVRAAGDDRPTWSQPEGFSFTYPDSWQVDTALGPVATRFSGPGVQLEVFQFSLTAGADLDTFWSYGNRSLKRGWSGLTIDQEWESTAGGNRALRIHWHRTPLPRLAGDMNHYAEVAVQRPGRLLWHAFLRATPEAYQQALADLQVLVDSLRFTTPTGASTWSKAAGAPSRDPFLQQPAPAGSPLPGQLDWRLPDKLVWGIYDPPLPADLSSTQALEQQLGGHFGVYMFYHVLGTDFPTAALSRIVGSGRMPMLTLQSWIPQDPNHIYDKDATLYLRILSGEYDDYFHRFARDAARFGHPLLFRFDNEMNGDWDAWSAFFYGKDTRIYRETWRYVHRIFDSEGATNLLWVWNPNADSYPAFGWNHQAMYYPGDDVVDWVGLTGYNTGGENWRSFREAYRSTYEIAQHLAPNKPLIITEFGSHDVGGDKAAWIRDMWETLPEFPKIRVAVWWNGKDDIGNYTIDSAPGSRQAFAQGFGAYAAVPFRFNPPPPGLPVRLELAGHWAAPVLQDLVDRRHLLQGFPDGTLQPDAPVTLAQYVKLLLSSRQLGPADGNALTGVAAEHWAKGWLEAAALRGALRPERLSSYQADGALSREEMADLTARLLGAQEAGQFGSRFTDHAAIDSAFIPAVYALRARGILSGNPDGSFAPRRTVTRAEAAVVIQRVLEASG